MKEGQRNGMREQPGCQDLQKHLKEGRKDCWNKDLEEERNEREREKMEEKRELREDKPSNTPDGREVRELEPRSMKEREMKEEIEDDVAEEERGN